MQLFRRMLSNRHNGAEDLGIVAADSAAAAGKKDDETSLLAAANAAVDGILVFDARGSILFFNPACERLFGYARSEIVGQGLNVLIPAVHPMGAEFRIAITGREETIGRRKDGLVFPVKLSIGAAQRSAGKIFTIGILHEISNREVSVESKSLLSLSLIAKTRRHRINREFIQAQRIEAIGELAGGIAHDFNNLLTVIIGNADMLTEKLQSHPELGRLAEQIAASAMRGAELAHRLLAFGRKQTLHPTAIDCNKLVESSVGMLRRVLPEDIKVLAQLDPDRPTVLADQAQLEAVILNLALNARDAMPEGGSLAITAVNLPSIESNRSPKAEFATGDYVLISVIDDGVGMPPDVRDRAFEPFFTTKDVGKGSGLGLSMAYGFAKQSNGHVAIASEPGLGTAVRLYLPAVAAKSDTTGLDDAGAADPAAPRGTGTVLMVEDDRFVLGYGASCLESLGYRVIPVSDGNEALQRLASSEPIDLLFSDIVMPGGISGRELVERARQIRPDLKVLLSSGYSRETLFARSRIDHDANLLEKPYRKVDLARRVHEMIGAIPRR